MSFRLPEHRKGVLALIIANIIWGAASPIFKLSLQNIQPFTLAYVRFLGGSLLLVPFAASQPWIQRTDGWKLILLSISGVTINISFFFLGLMLSPAINAPIIMASGPIFLYFFSILFLHEKPHIRILIGLLTSLFGIILIVGQPIIMGYDGKELLGNFFLILAMLGGIGHTLISKGMLERYPPSTVTFWSFLIGTLTFLPMFFIETRSGNPFASLDTRGMVGIVYGIFFSSAAAYFLFEWGLKKVKAQESGVFIYIDYIVATIISVFLFQEVITVYFLLGSALVFAGIFVAERNIHRHPYHRMKHR